MASSAKLLELAAAALDREVDPLSTAFLVEHEVTLDQARNLAAQLATGARIMARALAEPKSPEAQVMFADMMREPPA